VGKQKSQDIVAGSAPLKGGKQLEKGKKQLEGEKGEGEELAKGKPEGLKDKRVAAAPILRSSRNCRGPKNKQCA